MDIKELIVELQKTDTLIKDRDLLIEALVELDKMIGMMTLKRSVVDQLLFLLSNIRSKGVEHATDGHVLHTLLYGPPGVGKTVVGSILARIWASLGILGRTNIGDNPDSLVAKLFRDNINLKINCKFVQERAERALTAAEATTIKVREMRSRIFAIRTRGRRRPVSLPYDELGKQLEILDGDIQRLSRVSSDALNYSTMTSRTLQEQSTSNIDTSCCSTPSLTVSRIAPSASMSAPTLVQSVPNIQQPALNRPNFKVVSRIDFVAEYVGQTAVKSKKLLGDHKGGVLLVDEAYSLYQGDRDSFGSEALTVINQYMTENADSTVLIFAGYKEIMQGSIFKVQPGLARRFAFTFEIPGYEPTELAQIFTQQLDADSWQFDDPSELTTFFKDNYAYFPSYGGDTKRLIFQCKLIHSGYHWNQSLPSRILNLAILNEAFVRYKLHQPLNIDRLKSLEAQRTYEDELLHQKIREHQERKTHIQLYDEYRAFERDQMALRIKENRESRGAEELYDQWRATERSQIAQRIKESGERKANEPLYDQYRDFERYQMTQRLKENEERKASEELYDQARALERDELQRKVKENEGKKKLDGKFDEPPPGMYS